MSEISLDDLIDSIDIAFGAEVPCPREQADTAELFQEWLHDQVSRQVIRDYLVNAVRLKFLGRSGLGDYLVLLGDPDNRALLSLHMVMSSVEDAALLAADVSGAELVSLEADDPAPVQLELVRS